MTEAGGWKSAGLLDLQVNGFAGVDFNDETIRPEQVDHALRAMLATGVTTCLPTVITADFATLERRLRALDAALEESRMAAAMVPGLHLEGPFLNPEPGYAGCHPAEAMVPADWERVRSIEAALARPILLVTLAPERPGGLVLAKRASEAGKLVAIGHSAADHATVEAAAEAGARLSTHLGNGLPQTLPKLDNTLFAQLAEDRLSASFIADGVHLPPFALKSLIRAKGTERSVLVTDAVAAAAAPPGRYPLAGMAVDLGEDGAVRQPGGASLAGSALTLDRAVRNVVSWGLLDAGDALRLAVDNPRALLVEALAAHGAALSPSEVRWTFGLEIEAVKVGPWIWTAEAEAVANGGGG